MTAIHPDAAVGAVRLTVSDLPRSRAFYERVIGLRGSELGHGGVGFGVDGGLPLIELCGDPAAGPLDRCATGLYHLAVLLPSRRDLALALRRLAGSRWPLDGASDHLVSEALYLSDPDGNGIEIYRDRPREQWRRTGDALQMATLPLDLESLIGELDPGSAAGSEAAPEGTRIGHVHLQVSDLERAEQFYGGALGFEVMVRLPSALFLSAGGYHHHLGLNTWQSAGAGPPAPGSVGLRSFEITLPDLQELERTLARLKAARRETERRDASAVTRDPFGNMIRLRTG